MGDPSSLYNSAFYNLSTTPTPTDLLRTHTRSLRRPSISPGRTKKSKKYFSFFLNSPKTNSSKTRKQTNTSSRFSSLFTTTRRKKTIDLNTSSNKPPSFLRSLFTRTKKEPPSVRLSTAVPQSVNPRPQSVRPCRDDNTLCISVGYNTDTIINYFDNFSSKYINKFEKYKPKNGINSSIYACTFSRETYTANALLKLQKQVESDLVDNVFYEACVGSYINKQHKYFPCFVRTYRYGKFKLPTSLPIPNNIDVLYNENSTQFLNTIEELQSNVEDGILKSCETDKKKVNAVVIEYFLNNKTLFEFLEQPHDKHQVFGNDVNASSLYFIFFQVYSVLNQLKDEFTHYDLHPSNILMYRVKTTTNNGYIKMNYYTSKTVCLSFFTPYIVKIIDYGRCFFHYSEKFNSSIIYDKVCEQKACDKETVSCGFKRGYHWLDKKEDEDTNINATKKNISHDLWTLYALAQQFNKLKNKLIIVKKKDDDIEEVINDNKAGLYENETKTDDNKIRNVEDAYRVLLEICSDNQLQEWNDSIIQQNEQYWGTYIGELNVYLYKDDNGERIPTEWKPIVEL